jgi:hypothetical protein
MALDDASEAFAKSSTSNVDEVPSGQNISDWKGVAGFELEIWIIKADFLDPLGLLGKLGGLEVMGLGFGNSFVFLANGNLDGLIAVLGGCFDLSDYLGGEIENSYRSPLAFNKGLGHMGLGSKDLV